MGNPSAPAASTPTPAKEEPELAEEDDIPSDDGGPADASEDTRGRSKPERSRQ